MVLLSARLLTQFDQPGVIEANFPNIEKLPKKVFCNDGPPAALINRFLIVVFSLGISIRTGQFGTHRVHPVHNSANLPFSKLPLVPIVHAPPIPPE